MANLINFQTAQAAQDPKEMFINLERYTDMVIKGIQPSLLITGMPGLGKTHVVKQRMDKAKKVHGRDYLIVKGRCTAAGLYYTLYMNSDKTIIFDDCDSVFKDSDAINLLKAALDSYDERIISYISQKPLKDEDGIPLPTSFEFKGNIIFISNIAQEDLDPAVQSRSFVADITLTPQQMLTRMEQKLKEVEPKVDLRTKKKALAVLAEVAAEYENVELNFRSLIKAIRIAEMKFQGWEFMVAQQCVRVVKAKKGRK